MLTSFSVKNYKAFESAEINLKPVTLLLGPNNIGKTSLSEVLLLMQQTALSSRQLHRAPLKLHGRIVSVGVPENLFHNRNIEQPIEFGFAFDSTELASEIGIKYLIGVCT